MVWYVGARDRETQKSYFELQHGRAFFESAYRTSAGVAGLCAFSVARQCAEKVTSFGLYDVGMVTTAFVCSGIGCYCSKIAFEKSPDYIEHL